MIRVIVAAPLDPGRSPVALEAAELHHLDVRRARAGERVELLDGEGGVGTGRLRADGKRLLADVEAVRRASRPPELTLLVAAGDRDRLLWLVEKAQELGATRLVPVATERTASVATRLRPGHLDRMRRRAAEAMKQSGNPWRLVIEEPIDLATAAGADRSHVRWLADRAGPAATPPPATAPSAVLVGPEGGLSEAERDLAIAHGFSPVRLGAHVLRFETAAIAALTLLAVHREEGS